jgi:hypothetical protein
METRAHRRLKQLALLWLQTRGGMARATEVACPISRYRVDVAAYVDRTPAPRGWRSAPARTVFIECKQSRADFLRDRVDGARLIAQRAELNRVREAMERRQIEAETPGLRRSEAALFPEFETWDFSASRERGYHALLRRLRRLDADLYGQTKFWTIARYGLADELWIAAPRGLLRAGELPAGWGLLECDRPALRRRDAEPDLFGGTPFTVRRPAPERAARSDFRLRTLRNIAAASSRAVDAAAARALGRGTMTRRATAQRRAEPGRADDQRSGRSGNARLTPTFTSSAEKNARGRL